MNPHLQKAELLLEQGRHELAEKEARVALREEPNDVEAHCVLALALVQQEKLNDAEKAAGDAVHLGPAEPRAHYVMSRVLVERNRLKDATAAINEAIGLDPYDADFHAWLAAIRFDLSDWKGALAAAEKGLKPMPNTPAAAICAPCHWSSWAAAKKPARPLKPRWRMIPVNHSPIPPSGGHTSRPTIPSRRLNIFAKPSASIRRTKWRAQVLWKP